MVTLKLILILASSGNWGSGWNSKSVERVSEKVTSSWAARKRSLSTSPHSPTVSTAAVFLKLVSWGERNISTTRFALCLRLGQCSLPHCCSFPHPGDGCGELGQTAELCWCRGSSLLPSPPVVSRFGSCSCAFLHYNCFVGFYFEHVFGSSLPVLRLVLP